MIAMARRFPVVSSLTLLVVALAAAFADAGRTGPKRKVHVVVGGLTAEPGIARAVEYNVRQVRELFERGLEASNRGELRVLVGSDFNPRNVLDTIARMNVRPEDALFVYFHGHGAYDEAFKHADPSGGHFFAMVSGPSLMRKDLWQQMVKHNAALTVLVTESCYGHGRAAPYFPKGKKVGRDGRDNVVLAALLLNPRGQVDINAAARGELSWNFPVGRGGSFFTDSFVDMFHEFPTPATVTWRSFLEAVRDKTSGIYRAARKDVLDNETRFNAELVKKFKEQSDQRPTFIRLALGGASMAESKALTVGAGLVLKGKLTGSEARDRVRTQSFHRVHEVRLEAGKEYVIDLESSDMDMYLRLEGPGGVALAENDDFGGSLNSRLRFTPTVGGVYRIVATTYKTATGDYTLRIR